MNINLTLHRNSLTVIANRILTHCDQIIKFSDIGDSLSNILINNISVLPSREYHTQKTAIENMILSTLYNILTKGFRLMLKNLEENPSLVLDKKVIGLITTYMTQLILELDVRTYYSSNGKYVARPTIESNIIKNLSELELILVAYTDASKVTKEDTYHQSSVRLGNDFLALN